VTDERFELLEEIGAGGMGVVWKARDAESGDIVALKIVHAHLARDPNYIARFEREVEVARRIDSPHVVKVLGYGTREGLPYMAMEYVEGQSLRQILEAEGPMPWDRVKGLARQVAEGLAAVHAADVIHRDVKPSNILVTADGTAKLADFGVARALELTRLTGSSTMLGTPHYMAPEGTASAQSDLYSLGCVLFELLTGHPPFEGESQQAVIAAHIRETPPLSGLPNDARPLVAWLIAKSPVDRPAPAAAFVSALDDGRSPPIPRSTRLGRRRILMGTVATVLLTGGVIGVLLLNGGTNESSKARAAGGGGAVGGSVTPTAVIGSSGEHAPSAVVPASSTANPTATPSPVAAGSSLTAAAANRTAAASTGGSQTGQAGMIGSPTPAVPTSPPTQPATATKAPTAILTSVATSAPVTATAVPATAVPATPAPPQTATAAPVTPTATPPPTTPPTAPANLTVETLSATSIRFTWVDNSDNESGFQIWDQSSLINVGPNQRSFTATNLPSHIWTCYAVRSWNAVGSSTYTPGWSCTGTYEVTFGPLDWSAYCRHLGFARAILNGGTTAWHWDCQRSDGSIDTGDLNAKLACDWQYPQNTVIVDSYNYLDPYSWKCVGY